MTAVTGTTADLRSRLRNVTDWDKVRLHVVTGKGGTGKTTVAAAMALALASLVLTYAPLPRGSRTEFCSLIPKPACALLCDVALSTKNKGERRCYTNLIIALLAGRDH